MCKKFTFIYKQESSSRMDTFGAQYIKAKTQTEAFCINTKVSELNIYKLFNILYVFQR
jgi:hypothetical protein